MGVNAAALDCPLPVILGLCAAAAKSMSFLLAAFLEGHTA